MRQITPPPIIVQMHSAPERLNNMDTMEFTLWLGLLPIRWLARIENVTDHGFIDRQLEGPFETWVHTHHFEAKGSGTRVHDIVSYRIKNHPFWGIIGALMGVGLPLLFRYRAWRTKSLLTNNHPSTEPA
jgi:ligand-binding SRPBCC domain-containing protein